MNVCYIIIELSLIEHNKVDFDNLLNLIKGYPNLVIVMESTFIYQLKIILDLKRLILLL